MVDSVESQFEATPAHVAFVTFSIFLIVYASFSNYIRNNLHLSEPPLAVLYGIILGPAVLGVLRLREVSIVWVVEVYWSCVFWQHSGQLALGRLVKSHH